MVDWLSFAICIMMVSGDWCISVLIVPVRSCCQCRPLLYRSPKKLFPVRTAVVPVGLLCFSTVAIRASGILFHYPYSCEVLCEYSFLDRTSVPVKVTINKRCLVPQKIVSGLMGVFRNDRGLGTSKSYIPRFSLAWISTFPRSRLN